MVAGVEIRLLGPLTVSRAGAALVLPGSRKVRGLLAYLALAPHPIARSQLCELLWDVPNDPRGELRWLESDHFIPTRVPMEMTEELLSYFAHGTQEVTDYAIHDGSG